MHGMGLLPWMVKCVNALLPHTVRLAVQPCMHCQPPGSINVRGHTGTSSCMVLRLTPDRCW